MWISIFGNAAIDRIRGGNTAFAEVASSRPGAGFYSLLAEYPGSPASPIAVATFVGLLFYVTSADSGALVMGNLTSQLRNVQRRRAAGCAIIWAVDHRSADPGDAGGRRHPRPAVRHDHLRGAVRRACWCW